VLVSNPAGSVVSDEAVLIVNQLTQAISFSALPSKSTTDSPFSLTATASSGLPVTYTSSDTSVATVAGNTVTIRGAGATTITANQEGDATYRPAVSVSQNFVVQTALAITEQPTNQVASVGSDTSLSVRAVGGMPLLYQWLKDGVDLLNATNATLTLVNVATNQAGVYGVVVSDPTGSLISSPARLEIDAGSSAVRRLPSWYVIGSPLEVKIDINPLGGTAAHAIVENPPIGWAHSGISHGGVFDEVNKVLKWGPFFDSLPRTLTYSLVPPLQTSGSHTFSGIYSADGMDSAISGQDEIVPAPFHPSDILPNDYRIEVAELTSYSAAWKKGESWSVGPDPIPVSYVTRAALLWKAGETYALDNDISAPPLWWVQRIPTTSQVQKNGVSGDVMKQGVSRAVLSLPERVATGVSFRFGVAVDPAISVTAWAVEQPVPEGIVVTGVSDGGQFDSQNRLIKWGPFFDSDSRLLDATLSVEKPPGTFVGINGGVYSSDGKDDVVEGSGRIEIIGTVTKPVMSKPRKINSSGEFVLSVTLKPNSTYAVQVSDNMKTWVEIHRVSTVSGAISLIDREAKGKVSRFYRAVELSTGD
jgi:hypothetical protein